MYYKCLDMQCGHKFQNPRYSQEYLGEYWGKPAYETVGLCPVCGYNDIELIENGAPDDEEAEEAIDDEEEEDDN